MGDEDIKVHLERIRHLIKVEERFKAFHKPSPIHDLLTPKPPTEPVADAKENPDRIPTQDEKGLS